MDPTIDMEGLTAQDFTRRYKEAQAAETTLKSQGYASADYKEVLGQIDETRKPVSVISSEQAKNDVQNITDIHTGDMNRLSVEDNNRRINEEKFRKSAEANDRRNGGLSAEEIVGLGGKITDYDHNKSSGLYTPKSAGVSTTDKFAEDRKEIDNAFSAQQAFIDQATANLMSSINQVWNARSEAQKQLNTKSLESFRNIDLRTGQARFTQDSSQGLLNTVEQQGLVALNDIAIKQSSALAEAEQARVNKQYDLFAKKRDEITKHNENRQKVLAELQKSASEGLKKEQEKKREATLSSEIASLLSKNITDPSKILEALNGAGGNYSAVEIAKVLKALSPTDDIKGLTGETKNFAILKESGLLEILMPEIAGLPEGEQLQAYLNTKKKVPTPKTPKKIPKPVLKMTFTSANVKDLAAVNLTEDIIKHLEEGINKYGLKEVLEKETGLSFEQRKSLTDIFLKASSTPPWKS